MNDSAIADFDSYSAECLPEVSSDNGEENTGENPSGNN